MDMAGIQNGDMSVLCISLYLVVLNKIRIMDFSSFVVLQLWCQTSNMLFDNKECPTTQCSILKDLLLNPERSDLFITQVPKLLILLDG